MAFFAVQNTLPAGGDVPILEIVSFLLAARSPKKGVFIPLPESSLWISFFSPHLEKRLFRRHHPFGSFPVSLFFP